MNALSEIELPAGRELRRSEATNELIAALVRAKPKFERVTKDGEVKIPGKMQFRFASLGEIMDATEPALLAEGLVVLQMVACSGPRTVLVTHLAHTSGQWMEASAPIMVAGQTPQALGSGITYLRRYSYSAMLGIVADEDDDGQKASLFPRQPPAKAAPRPRDAVDRDSLDGPSSYRGEEQSIEQKAGAVNSAGMTWPVLSRSGEAHACKDRADWLSQWRIRLSSVRDAKNGTPEQKRATLHKMGRVNAEVFADLRERGDSGAVDAIERDMAALDGLLDRQAAAEEAA